MIKAQVEVEPVVKPKRKLSKFWKAAGIILLIVAAWIVYDLYGPRSTSLRRFDPQEVGRLEAAMWRSYYQKQRVRLFNQMTELLRTQYNLPFFRSNKVGYSAARAAFVFKDGHNRAEYERALPYLVDFYSAIHQVSDIDFDINRAARLELEWWIIHRQRASHKPENLQRALAELPAELYQMPAEKFIEHARLRAEAMTIRDTKALDGGVTEEDWKRIEELLRASWQSLYEAVNS
ncbi:MAG: hypothetical protein AB1631_07135 [Acidobacteriota bacterium]